MTTDESQISIKQEAMDDNDYNAANNITPGKSFTNQMEPWNNTPMAPLLDNNNDNNYFNNNNNNNNGMVDGGMNEMGSNGRSEEAVHAAEDYNVDARNASKEFNNKSEHSSSNNTTNNEYDEDEDEYDDDLRKQKRPRLTIVKDNMNKNNTNNNVDYNDLNDDGAGGDEENNGFIASNNLPQTPLNHGNI